MLSGLNPTQKGIFLAICGFSAFAVSDACAKWLSPAYPVFTIVGFIALFSVITGLVASPLLGGLQRTLRTEKLWVHTGRGASNILLCYFAVLSFAHIPFADVYTILFLAPFLVTLMAAPIYGEKVDKASWGIIALGFSGILIAYPPGSAEVSPWIFAPFAATVFIASLGLLARKLGPDETVLSLSFYPSLFSVLAFVPISIWGGHWPAMADLPVFILGGVMITGGLSGIAGAFRIAPYALVSPFNYLQMIWALLLGALVFDEMPTVNMLLGAAVIIGSGLMLVRKVRGA